MGDYHFFTIQQKAILCKHKKALFFGITRHLNPFFPAEDFSPKRGFIY